MPRYTFRYSVTSLRIDRIFSALQKEPLTSVQIASEIYLSARWTREYIIKLHEQKRIYICGYRQHSRGEPVPIYAVGSERDAVKPRKKTNAAKSREDWAKLKGDRERYDAFLARKRARSIKPKRDAFVAAIFGAVA